MDREYQLIGQFPVGMHGDLYAPIAARPGFKQILGSLTGCPRSNPVPGNLIAGLIDCGHDGVRSPGPPDQEPEPPLIGEGDSSACPVVKIHSRQVHDGRSRIVDDLPHAAGFVSRWPAMRLCGLVAGAVPPVLGGEVGDARRP